MQAMKSDRPVARPNSTNKFISVAIILAILITAGLVVFNSYQSKSTSPAATVILHSALEETYGLRLNLVAVTASGGFVDLRLKIMDGDKAKLLLADKKDFPSLVAENGVTLNAPADTKSQKIEFISGGNLFVMYPNSGNAVLQGSPVTILFGDIRLEPIVVK
jgi:hypothetical protein